MKIAKQRAIIIFIIVILLFLIFSYGGNILFFFLRPIQRGFHQVPEYSLSGNENWQNQKFLLEEEIVWLKEENVRFKIYQQENKILREQLNFLEASKDNFILADIIGKRTEAGFIWFLLDRGTDLGITEGLAVVDEKGYLVGTIIKAEKSISFLQPVFDCHSLIAADIISSEKSLGGISGLIQGEYGTSMKMRYVPWDKQIKAGDVVITSGLQEKIRRGLVIGEIAEISKKPNAVFQEVIVRPLKSFQDLRIVSVLIR